MATIDFSGIPEILAELRRRGEGAEDVAQAMLNAGAAAAIDSWRKTVDRLGLVKTGAMRESIGVTKASRRSRYREITANGKDKRGVRNAEKAFILHYGTSRIEPTYWWDTAEQEAEPLVMAAMKSVWEKWIASQALPPDTTGDNQT